jgi:glycosyltransferase involved in cell wall biosynthesis
VSVIELSGVLERRSQGKASADAEDGLRVGLVGTYPPTVCGIATFTQSVARSLGPDARPFVVSAVDAPGRLTYPREVVAELVAGSPESRRRAASALSRADVVIVQHEFGIYGGEHGREVLDLLGALDVPAIVVLHTVLDDPDRARRAIVEELAERAAAVVVPSVAAGTRLASSHRIDPDRVHLIPHGARPNLSSPPSLDDASRPATILTWGLIGPGKGIEVAVRAMAALVGSGGPAARYVVLGQTHPRVLEHQGERYREALVALAGELGVADRIVFDNRYHDTDRILERIREADVVLLPYHSRDQVVSGVLVEALASSTAVVSTAFPHACELLAGGAGIVVPHDDPSAMAAALQTILEPGTLSAATARARAIAPSLAWDTVGRRYARLAARVCAERARLTPR